MKKRVMALVLALVLMSAGVVWADSSPAASYWDEMKRIYEEWNAMESDLSAHLTLTLPGEEAKVFNVSAVSKSNMEDFVSWMQVEIEVEGEELEIPLFEMFTRGSDIYVNSAFVLFVAELMEMGDKVAIAEEYVMLKNEGVDMKIDANFLVEVLELMEGMELGFEMDITLEDGVYHLTITGSQMVDMLDVYIRYTIANMDKMIELTGMTAEDLGVEESDLQLTDEQVAEALQMYETMVAPMLDMARGAIVGSFYEETTTYEEDGYVSDGRLFFTTPFGQMDLTMESTVRKVDDIQISLPTSVKVYTEDDLANLMMAPMTGSDVSRPVAMLDVNEGMYVQFVGHESHEGEVDIIISAEGRSYLSKEDALDIFGLEIEEEMMAIRSLEDHGYQVVWNSEFRIIEVYAPQP